jgi:hypothetical protein
LSPGVPEAREMAAEARTDKSLLVLLAANLVALAIAYASKMSLRELMLVYWIQSVVIGVASVIRIARLERFDTADLRINDRQVAETPATKRQVAAFFAVHYGFFHLIYFVFIAAGPARADAGRLAPLYVYAVLALIFAANHGYSLAHNLRRDARGRPNIGTLMFLPYARIVPMHLTIIFGGLLAGSTFAFFLFGLLKTAADAVMHVVEHRVLGKTPRAAG